MDDQIRDHDERLDQTIGDLCRAAGIRPYASGEGIPDSEDDPWWQLSVKARFLVAGLAMIIDELREIKSWLSPEASR